MIDKVVGIFKKSAAVQNASWLIAGKIIQMLMSFFVTTFTARYLGPSNYGLLNYGSAYMALFMPICSLGIDSIIVNELILNRDKESTILGTGIGIRCIASLVSIGMIQALVMFLEPNRKLLWIVVFLQSWTLVLKSFDLLELYFQSKLQSKNISIASTIAYVITVVYKIWILFSGKSVIWFAFAGSLDLLFVAIIYLYIYCLLERKKFAFDVNFIKPLLSRSYHFILSSLMVVIYAQMDRIMLGHMLDADSVGLYSMGTTISSLWVFVLTAIINSIRPLIIEAKKSGDVVRYKRKIVQLYGIIFWLGMAVSFIFCIFAKFIVLILYGNAYAGGIVPFQIVTWYTAFSYLGVARSIWMICENMQKYEKYIAMLGAIVNVVLNYVFIYIWGVSGAALATLITQIMTNFVCPFFIPNIRPNSIFISVAIFHPIRSVTGRISE